MESYVALLRGINVGGKNKVSMAELRHLLEKEGCKNVTTYINSGNVLLQSELSPAVLGSKVEKILSKNFKLDSSIIKVLVLTEEQLSAVFNEKPEGFGDQPEKYHSDVIFLIGISANDVMPVFKRREGVDEVWQGNAVVYSQRLSALRTKSRLNKIMNTPAYKSMTIRNWNTTIKLYNLLKA